MRALPLRRMTWERLKRMPGKPYVVLACCRWMIQTNAAYLAASCEKILRPHAAHDVFAGKGY